MLTFKNATINKEIKTLPFHNNLEVEMKNGDLYKYKKQVEPKLYKVKPFGYYTQFIEMENKEKQQSFTFAFINTDKGVFVTHDTNFMLEVNEKALKSLATLLNIEYETKEEKYLEKIEELLKNTTKYYDTIAVPQGRHHIKCSNYHTLKNLREFYYKIKGKEYKNKKALLISDMTLVSIDEFLQERRFVIEAERTFHKQVDYLWKLYKLSAIENNVSQIVLVFNGEKNLEYHMDLVYQFEKMTGRSFKRLHYCTIGDLEKRGELAILPYK